MLLSIGVVCYAVTVITGTGSQNASPEKPRGSRAMVLNKVILPPRRHLATFIDIFCYHNSGRGVTIGTWWAEFSDTAKHSTMHKSF